ncbi:hypothetical protein J3R82DRAFT_11263 [Butyriboletus roseoflavus]|nr:hypothetical protein J3R82DRAFT_11263 [Butyriboletus roseoflavus]
MVSLPRVVGAYSYTDPVATTRQALVNISKTFHPFQTQSASCFRYNIYGLRFSSLLPQAPAKVTASAQAPWSTGCRVAHTMTPIGRPELRTRTWAGSHGQRHPTSRSSGQVPFFLQHSPPVASIIDILVPSHIHYSNPFLTDSVVPSCHHSDYSRRPLLHLHALLARIASLAGRKKKRYEDAARSLAYIVRTNPASPAVQSTALEIRADFVGRHKLLTIPQDGREQDHHASLRYTSSLFSDTGWEQLLRHTDIRLCQYLKHDGISPRDRCLTDSSSPVSPSHTLSNHWTVNARTFTTGSPKPKGGLLRSTGEDKLVGAEPSEATPTKPGQMLPKLPFSITPSSTPAKEPSKPPSAPLVTPKLGKKAPGIVEVTINEVLAEPNQRNREDSDSRAILGIDIVFHEFVHCKR